MAGEWTTLPLEDCMDAIIDYRGKTPEKTTFGIPLVTAKVIKSGRIERPDEFIAEADFDSWMRRGMPKSGDIVMTTEAPLGEVAQLDGTKVALAQRVITLRGKADLLDNTFLKFLLQSSEVQEELRSRGTGTTIVGIRQSELRKVSLTFPPLAEQKAIAAVLGALDDKIELNRRMNATLEAMARALFQSWFVDFDPVHAKAAGRQPTGMDPTTAALFPGLFQESELGDIPNGWEIGRLDDLLELQRGFDLPASNRKFGKYPVMAASGINGFHDAFMALGPGVTTGRSGVLGKVFFVHSDYWPLNTSLWVRTFKKASPTYVFHLLQDLDLGSFNAGSAVPTLNRNHVHDLQILIPPRSIIESFDRVAIPLMKTKKKYEDQSCTLASLRDTLLPKLLNGELSASKYLSDIEVV